MHHTHLHICIITSVSFPFRGKHTKKMSGAGIHPPTSRPAATMIGYTPADQQASSNNDDDDDGPLRQRLKKHSNAALTAAADDADDYYSCWVLKSAIGNLPKW
jgi:hypothetical protein